MAPKTDNMSLKNGSSVSYQEEMLGTPVLSLEHTWTYPTTVGEQEMTIATDCEEVKAAVTQPTSQLTNFDLNNEHGMDLEALLFGEDGGKILLNDNDNHNAPIVCVVKEEEDNDHISNKKEEFVMFEADLPVNSQSISHDFNSSWKKEVLNNSVDPMACFNPFEVEGVKKQRKILPKLDITAANQAEQPAQNFIDTPAIEQAMNCTNEQEDFDLLEYVTNTELPVEDPSFLALISTTPNVQEENVSLETIDVSAIATTTPVEQRPKRGKRKRQSPSPVASTSKAAFSFAPAAEAKKRRGRPPKPILDHNYKLEADSDYSENDIKNENDPRYRRMRDLNNLASKRCRQNRKRKFQALEGEEEELRRRNAQLKMRCKHLEDLVGKMKKAFLQKVTNPQKQKKSFDLEQILTDRLEAI